MLIKYGRGYEEEDREDFVDSIFENTIDSMKTLINYAKEHDEEEWVSSREPFSSPLEQACRGIWASHTIQPFEASQRSNSKRVENPTNCAVDASSRFV